MKTFELDEILNDIIESEENIIACSDDTLFILKN